MPAFLPLVYCSTHPPGRPTRPPALQPHVTSTPGHENVRFAPAALVYVALFRLLPVSVAMGATGEIESYEEAFLDVGVALMVGILFVPLLALVACFIVALIKQESNSAILFLLIGHLVVRFVLMLGFVADADSLTLLPHMLALNVAGMLAIGTTFAGGIMSNLCRPLNE